MILIGATAFSLVFNELGGQDMALKFFAEDMGSKWSFYYLCDGGHIPLGVRDRFY